MFTVIDAPVTDAVIISSNVTEDDYDEWDVATDYVAEDRIIVLSSHEVYEAVQSTTGDDPTQDDGTNWLLIGNTNRWKAFNRKISQKTERSGTITYSFTPDSLVTAIAFFGLEASTVTVEVFNADRSESVLFEEYLLTHGEVNSWHAWVHAARAFRSEVLLSQLPSPAGGHIDVTIDAGADTARVGRIYIGQAVQLGNTTTGTELSRRNFSTVEQSEVFGDTEIIRRPSSKRVRFDFATPTRNVNRVLEIIDAQYTTEAVYYAFDDSQALGTVIFGLPQPLDIPLSGPSISLAELTVQGTI